MIVSEVVCLVALEDNDAARRGFHNQSVYQTYFQSCRLSPSAAWQGGRRAKHFGTGQGYGGWRFPGRGCGLGERDNPFQELSGEERHMLANCLASNLELLKDV